jgi:hypothetical protein
VCLWQWLHCKLLEELEENHADFSFLHLAYCWLFCLYIFWWISAVEFLNDNEIKLTYLEDLVSRLVSSIGRALDCESTNQWFDSWTAQVTFVVIEIFSMVIPTVQKFQFLAKVKQLVLVKCLTACPGMMQWLNCALVNSVWLTVMI